MTRRADIFGDDDLDVSGFKPGPKKLGPPAEAVRQVAENTAFRSREPEASISTPISARPPRRERRIYRTGRDAHFSCKARPDVVDAFYAISNEQGWVMGETLQRAVDALKRELDQR